MVRYGLGLWVVLICVAATLFGARASAQDDSDYHPAKMNSIFPVYTEPHHNMYTCDKNSGLCKDEIDYFPDTASSLRIYDCRSILPPCADSETEKIGPYHVSVSDHYVQVQYHYIDSKGHRHDGDGWVDSKVLKEKPPPFDYATAKLYPRDGSSGEGVVPPADAVGCKDCADAKKKVSALGSLFNLFNPSSAKSGTSTMSIEAGDRKNCPTAFEDEKGPGGFQLSLERKTIQGPASYLGGDGPWYYPVKPVAAGTKKDVCEIGFPGGCGQDDLAPIFKLDWMKQQLRVVNHNVCSAAVAKFNNECDPYAKMKLKDRRNLFLKAAIDAVNSFSPEKGKTTAMRPYSEKPHKGKHEGPAEQVPLVRSHELSAHLAQCLMQRENYEFLPTKLNFTECAAPQKVRDKHGHTLNGTVLRDHEGRMIFDSHANGLFQVVESVASDLFDRKIYGNYCEEFSGYWTQVNKANHWTPQCKPSKDSEALMQNMSESPMLQVPIGIETLNYDLVKAEWNLRRASNNPSHEEVEKLALKEFWFHTRDAGDWTGVMSCEKCMDDHGSNPCCLQKSRLTDKDESCKW